MANVLFSRTDSPSTKPITDGQIIFDTSGNGKMYLDNGTTRLEMGGAIEVDATLDATSTNPIQNKGVAGVMLGELEEIRGTTKKGFLTDALATKTLDAKIGTTDISSIGDGTVTGAISDVNGKLMDNVITLADNIYLHKYGNLRILNIADVSANNIHQLKLPTDSIPKEDIRTTIMLYDNSQKNYLGLIRYLISKGYIECYGLINYASTLTVLTNATTKISGQLIWIV